MSRTYTSDSSPLAYDFIQRRGGQFKLGFRDAEKNATSRAKAKRWATRAQRRAAKNVFHFDND